MDKNKMLIDATHPEETRVVVLRNGRVEEFDYESAARKLLRGNIYLAKVTRVEPSLQAAFVEYGGNRHGFLAFNEIHPDYYQIPIADRELLKQEEAEAEAAAEAEADERARRRESRGRRSEPLRSGRRNDSRRGERSRDERRRDRGDSDAYGTDERPEASSAGAEQPHETAHHDHDHPHDHSHAHEHTAETASADTYDRGMAVEDHQGEHPHGSAPVGEHKVERHSDTEADFTRPAELTDQVREAPAETGHAAGEHDTHGGAHDRGEADNDNAEVASHIEEVGEPGGNGDNGNGEADVIEQVASEEDALEEVPERPRRRARQYKIQEVIKRRQIILVQVVKEERGNKGAALTTYISLAGRYTVLMPNTGRGGGISRKITQPQDRKRLKAIAEELEVPEGMGLIIRTAGAARTKQEIKRDYEYLLRLWESVRDLTLSSVAPCLVYEEGNLIKRSIRDLYSKDIDDIIVAGKEAHREAHEFMGMLMPGHADSVVRYEQPEPLFTRFGIERQLNAMFNPVVTLRSGGYIVINQTEALVAIDVNSGKSTREFSIEETALNTNIEAAEEIARQLKLRDLAGLIVVDFIDMEEKRNNRSVERRLKDALRHDRARIQVGRISHFGLLEMSRQRLRTGVLEGSTSQCPHCQGSGIIRSTESVALAVLRGLEDLLMKQPSSLCATTTAGVALYILNNKRPFIHEMERRFGIVIVIEASDRMQGANFTIERTASAPVDHVRPTSRTAVSMDWGFDGASDADEEPREPQRDRSRDRDRDRDRDDDGAEPRDHEDGEETLAREEGGNRRRRRRRRGRRDRDERHETSSGEREGGEGGGETRYGEDRERREHREHRDHDEAPVPATEMSAGDADLDDDGEGARTEDRAREQGATGDLDRDRPRRGRRRGRRGGRSRSREEGAGESGREAGGESDSHNWRMLDVSRPGAEQPVHDDKRTAHGIIENQAEPQAFSSEASGEARVSIIETVSAEQREEASVRSIEPEPHARTVRPLEAPHATAATSEVAPVEAPAPIPVMSPMPAASEPGTSPAPSPAADEPSRPARKGWWQRKFGAGE